MNNSVWLAILAFVFYGFAGPFMKYAHQSGILTRDFIFMASLTTLVAAIFWDNGERLFSSLSMNRGLVAAILAGVFLTGGFISLNQGLSGPLAIASVVFVISSANPLLSSLINLFYLGEKDKVMLPMLIGGSLLIIIGTILVGLSPKSH